LQANEGITQHRFRQYCWQPLRQRVRALRRHGHSEAATLPCAATCTPTPTWRCSASLDLPSINSNEQAKNQRYQVCSW